MFACGCPAGSRPAPPSPLYRHARHWETPPAVCQSKDLEVPAATGELFRARNFARSWPLPDKVFLHKPVNRLPLEVATNIGLRPLWFGESSRLVGAP
jgi:hypothetical protein